MKAVVIATLVVASAPVGLAQAPPSPQSAPPAAIKMRHELQVMERALEDAALYGIRLVSQQVPLLLLRQPIRARGFRLDDYGLFFEVEVPAVRRSIIWSMQTLGQFDGSLASALEELRREVQQLRDTPARANLEQTLGRIETQVVAPPGAASPASGRVSATAAPPAGERPAPRPRPIDLTAAYTDGIKRALLDAMLQHSGSLSIGPDEWLTVTARDNQIWVAPTGPADLTTFTLRVRGRDLIALRDGRASLEETRKRVEAREF